MKEEIKLTLVLLKYQISNRYYLKPFTDLWVFYIKPEVRKLLKH